MDEAVEDVRCMMLTLTMDAMVVGSWLLKRRLIYRPCYCYERKEGRAGAGRAEGRKADLATKLESRLGIRSECLNLKGEPYTLFEDTKEQENSKRQKHMHE